MFHYRLKFTGDCEFDIFNMCADHWTILLARIVEYFKLCGEVRDGLVQWVDVEQLDENDQVQATETFCVYCGKEARLLAEICNEDSGYDNVEGYTIFRSANWQINALWDVDDTVVCLIG